MLGIFHSPLKFRHSWFLACNNVKRPNLDIYNTFLLITPVKLTTCFLRNKLYHFFEGKITSLHIFYILIFLSGFSTTLISFSVFLYNFFLSFTNRREFLNFLNLLNQILMFWAYSYLST